MRRQSLYSNAIIIVGVVAILLAIGAGGGAGIFLNWESFAITVLGSFAALIMNYSWEDAISAYKDTRELFRQEVPDPLKTVEEFGSLAMRARREGLLVLEDEIPSLDPFLGKGLQMIIDGVDPAAIEQVLQTELVQIQQRHRTCGGMLGTWGSYAPAFGMIGTIIGLVKMLANLEDPTTIGPAMAVALVTTFYGAVMANLLLLPLAGKVGLKSQKLMLQREMIMEGLSSLQAGVNPRIIEQRLRAFIVPMSPSQRAGEVAKDEAANN